MSAPARRTASRSAGLAPLSPRVRLRVWLSRSTLGEALAARADPDRSAELRAVAHELIGTRRRRAIADGLDRILRDASRSAAPWTAALPLNRREILAARAELRALAERLRDPAPVTTHGMALADLLLNDGASPLYDRSARGSLWRLARTARERLDEPIC